MEVASAMWTRTSWQGAMLTEGTSLWTKDRRLHEVAEELGLV
jgi:hypothetical protein